MRTDVLRIETSTRMFIAKNQSKTKFSKVMGWLWKDINQHCGCFAPPAGRCSVCGKTSCQRCHQHCGGTENPSPLGCGRPLCREHSHFIPVEDGRTLPFCDQCSGDISRKRLGKKITGLLLAPFSSREAKDDR